MFILEFVGLAIFSLFVLVALLLLLIVVLFVWLLLVSNYDFCCWSSVLSLLTVLILLVSIYDFYLTTFLTFLLTLFGAIKGLRERVRMATAWVLHLLTFVFLALPLPEVSSFYVYLDLRPSPLKLLDFLSAITCLISLTAFWLLRPRDEVEIGIEMFVVTDICC